MVKKLIFSLVAVALLAPVGGAAREDEAGDDRDIKASVETRASVNSGSGSVNSGRGSINSGSGSVKAEVRAEVKADIQAVREENREELRKMMEERKAEFERNREEARQRFEAAQEAVKERREEIRNTLRERLEAFKDQRKAEVVARISVNLDKVNENITTMFAGHLDRMTEIVNRAEARVAASTTVEFTANVAAARAAIVDADAAVTAQAGKTYNLTVTETTVRADVQAAAAELRKDLAAVKVKVEAAKEAVRKVLQSSPVIDSDDDSDDSDDDSDDDNSTSSAE